MDFFSKCDQIRSFLRIWSHLLKKSLMENCFWKMENCKADNIADNVFTQVTENRVSDPYARNFYLKVFL